MVKIGLIGIVAAFLALPLKKEKTEYAMAVGMIAGILIFFYVLAEVSYVTDFINEVLKYLPIDKSYMLILFKILGITYIAEFSSNICKDAGYSSVAGQIEIFAKLSILILSIPGLKYILDILNEFL